MKQIQLNKIDTGAPGNANKEELKKDFFSLHKKMISLQHLFYANASRSMLIVFQGMDTSGKDGTIRLVFSCVNPLGVHATAFSEPCDKESKKWDDYIRTYENIISRCSPAIPWQVIPSEDKWYRSYLVASAIVGKLESLEMKYPDEYRDEK